ncbi:GntR family transcriptional regulator [Roseococcus sp. YIM B11640]|uniref:GntR family transcriptional regulator n=1 Tax=Roseococcus sp. YIM B11640 TaxID=3133973 RepID=UPI003C7A90C3
MGVQALAPSRRGPVAASRFGRLPAGKGPLYQRLADRMEKVILRLGLAEGAQLPTEEQLTQHFAVSMITVRGALRELHQRGLIERRQGRGTFVREPHPPAPEWGIGSMEEIEALTRLTGVRLRLSEPAAVPEWAMASLGARRGDSALRLRITREQDGVPFMLTDALYPPGVAALLCRQPLDPLLQRKRILLEMVESLTGERASSIRQEMSAARAPAEIARLLGIKAGEPVLVITRVATLRDGRVLQAARSYYRTDSAVYTVELKRS